MTTELPAELPVTREDALRLIRNLRSRYVEELARLDARAAILRKTIEAAAVLENIEGPCECPDAARSKIMPKRLGRYPKRDRAVDEAKRQTSVFTAPLIRELLRSRFPSVTFDKSVVSHALRRAVDQGVLDVVEAGAGARPTVYRNRNPTLALDIDGAYP